MRMDTLLKVIFGRKRILEIILQRKRIGVSCLITLVLFFECLGLVGCQWGETAEVKEKNLEMVALSEEVIPEKLLEAIEERKAKPFELSFKDNKYLYICVGYGQKEQPGYSVVVDDLYKSNLGIHISTTLLGPATKEEACKESSYPYLVIRTELSDDLVIYQ